MVSQCVLFTSCSSSLKASELVRQILSVDELPTCEPVLEDIRAYPWHIDTKYYTADVSLCTTEARTVGDQSFADAIQAFVIVFDSQQPASFEQVLLWLPYLKELKPTVQLLVCSHCTDSDAVSRNRALHWCIDNSFELVELDSTSTDADNSDEEDDFKETIGVQRIIEALSCHSWPNLVMKDNPTFRSSYIQQMLNEAARTIHSNPSPSTNQTAVPNDTKGDSVLASAPVEKPVSNVDNNVKGTNSADPGAVSVTVTTDNCAARDSPAASDCRTTSTERAATADNCTDEESFEQLFERLQLMKDAATGMSVDDRKKYAEQVTMQFWQAIGGNMDEFEGLSDISDSD